MKKLFIILVAAVLGAAPCMSQREPAHGKGPGKEPMPDLTELISDLSSSQKRKLDALSSESKARVEKLRAQQRVVRDSINSLMELEGDQSKAIYPLFDREAKLQTEISREMYATKVRINEVLTPDQRKQFRQCGRRHGKKRQPKQ